ncbi:MAG: hypothetical protein ACXABG_12355, partial [Promethearchaeota archaeon]
LLKNIGDSSFYMYLIHPFIAIPLSLGISFIPFSPVAKFFFVSVVTVILCYLVSHYFLEKIHFNRHKKKP